MNNDSRSAELKYQKRQSNKRFILFILASFAILLWWGAIVEPLAKFYEGPKVSGTATLRSFFTARRGGSTCDVSFSPTKSSAIKLNGVDHDCSPATYKTPQVVQISQKDYLHSTGNVTVHHPFHSIWSVLFGNGHFVFPVLALLLLIIGLVLFVKDQRQIKYITSLQ